MKKLWTIIPVILMLAGICGCSSPKMEEVPEVIQDGEYSYTSEFRAVDLGCDYAMGSTISDETIILLGVTEEKNGNRIIDFIRYNLESGEQEKIESALTIGKTDFIDCLCINSDGNILAVIMEKGQTILKEFDIAQGNILSETDITEVLKSAGSDKSFHMAIDKEDNIAISNRRSKIWLLDKSGKLMGELSVKGSNSVFTSKDGSFCAAVRNEKGITVMPVNMKTKELGEPFFGPAALKGEEREVKFDSGKKAHFLFKDAEGMYSFDAESGKASRLFQWEAEGINSSVIQFGEYGDGNYFILSETSDSGIKVSFEIALMQKADKSASAKKESEASGLTGKQEIIYGAIYAGSFYPGEIKKRIEEFNRSNDKYTIVFKNYGEGLESSEPALEQLNLDIMTGKMPDILELGTMINYNQYAEKEVFEDLYPYMERDGIKREDYLENILNVYADDEKLYGIIPKFFIETTMGKKSEWGENPKVTVEDVLNKLDEKKNKEIGFHWTRQEVLNYLFYASIEDFIDWETGECLFKSEDFIRILETAADYPDIEFDYKNIDIEKMAEEDIEYMRQIKEGRFLLDVMLMSSVEDYLWYQEMFGDDLTCVGYPNKEGSGNLIRAHQPALCISTDSENKDGAWEYVKMQISDENQYKDLKFEPEAEGEEETTFAPGFPIKKAALDKMLEESLNPVIQKDENGKEKTRMYGYIRREIELKGGREKEAADAVRAIINSVRRYSGKGNSIMIYDIIAEESAPYFEGKKAVEEVADIIQNRVQIYVNESR